MSTRQYHSVAAEEFMSSSYSWSQSSRLVFLKAVTGCDGYGPLGPASVFLNGFLVCMSIL